MQPGKYSTEKYVQFNKASSNCLQEVLQPQSLKMSQLTQCRDSSTLWAPLKTVCSEDTGQLLNRGLFSLLSYPSNLDQILCLESLEIKQITLYQISK